MPGAVDDSFLPYTSTTGVPEVMDLKGCKVVDIGGRGGIGEGQRTKGVGEGGEVIKMEGRLKDGGWSHSGFIYPHLIKANVPQPCLTCYTPSAYR